MKHKDIEKLAPLIGKHVRVTARSMSNNFLIRGILVEIDRSNPKSFSIVVKVKEPMTFEHGGYSSGLEYVDARHLNSVVLDEERS